MVFGWISETFQDVRSNPESAMSRTADIIEAAGMICESLGTVVPFVGIVGGALKMGAGFMGMKSKNEEISMEDLQTELQDSFSEVNNDIKEINQELGCMKNLVTGTYEIAVNLEFKQDIEMVESSFRTFLKGSHDMQGVMEELKAYIYELNTKADQSLDPAKLQNYLHILKGFRGNETAKIAFNYCLIVKAKYLSLVTAYYLFQMDDERVENEYVEFNDHLGELISFYAELFEEDFSAEDCPKPEVLLLETRRSMLKNSARNRKNSEEEDDDDEVEEEEENELDEDGDESLKQFLNGIDLLHLYPKLLEEAVELDTLLECNNHDDLKELGIEKAGHRCKILKTIKQGNYGKNQLMYIF